MNDPHDPRTLLTLIRDLDADTSTEHEYVAVSRWHIDGGGSRDDEATALFRSLLRAELGKFHVADIGAAVLADIDSRSPA